MSVRSRLTRGSTIVAAGLAAALALTACGSSSDPLAQFQRRAAPPASAAASGSGSAAAGGTIVIGSANFPESALLANIYAAALKAKGVEASTNLNIGSREVYIKALQDGSIDLVPEYTGVLLQYFDPTATAISPTTSTPRCKAKTPDGLDGAGQVRRRGQGRGRRHQGNRGRQQPQVHRRPRAGRRATSSSAVRPSGRPGRPVSPGCKSVYGLTFKEFKALDAGGPLTLNALTGDQIQAGNLFTTDPAIPANDLVVLEDPKNLFAAQNILPLISSDEAHPGGRPRRSTPCRRS